MTQAAQKSKKEKIPRQAMPEQAPEVRAKNFEEVPLGQDPEAAVREHRPSGGCTRNNGVPTWTIA